MARGGCAVGQTVARGQLRRERGALRSGGGLVVIGGRPGHGYGLGDGGRRVLVGGVLGSGGVFLAVFHHGGAGFSGRGVGCAGGVGCAVQHDGPHELGFLLFDQLHHQLLGQQGGGRGLGGHARQGVGAGNGQLAALHFGRLHHERGVGVLGGVGHLPGGDGLRADGRAVSVDRLGFHGFRLQGCLGRGGVHGLGHHVGSGIGRLGRRGEVAHVLAGGAPHGGVAFAAGVQALGRGGQSGGVQGGGFGAGGFGSFGRQGGVLLGDALIRRVGQVGGRRIHGRGVGLRVLREGRGQGRGGLGAHVAGVVAGGDGARARRGDAGGSRLAGLARVSHRSQVGAVGDGAVVHGDDAAGERRGARIRGLLACGDVGVVGHGNVHAVHHAGYGALVGAGQRARARVRGGYGRGGFAGVGRFGGLAVGAPQVEPARRACFGDFGEQARARGGEQHGVAVAVQAAGERGVARPRGGFAAFSVRSGGKVDVGGQARGGLGAQAGEPGQGLGGLNNVGIGDGAGAGGQEALAFQLAGFHGVGHVAPGGVHGFGLWLRRGGIRIRGSAAVRDCVEAGGGAEVQSTRGVAFGGCAFFRRLRVGVFAG